MTRIQTTFTFHAGLAERMLFAFCSMYHGQLGKGESFLHLRPVISIWLLRGAMYPEIEDYHLPFGAYNLRHRKLLTDQMAIHILQLPKWQRPKRRPDERDRWMYFFKEGKHLDPAHPPDLLQTKEMKQAMNVLTEFSEKEKDYLLYEQRLEAERVELTWREQLENEHKKIERLLQEKELERQEKERLLALLQQAGIDPSIAE